MTDKIIKQNVFIYNSEGIPIDITKYVRNWTISNGGIKAGSTGIDGIVQTGTMVLQNDMDVNFNPEAEYGVLKTEIIQFVGDGTSSYAGVPSGVWTKAVAFNKIYNGLALEWDDITTWNSWTSWNQTSGATDNSGLYGNVKVSGSNFITPYNMPSGTLFEIIYTYIDYTERNPINTVDDDWSPLLDENAKIEIYALTEDIQWEEYEWVADGTNRFANPVSGTPLVSAIGISKATYDFYTTATYDQVEDEIVLGATPTTSETITFSISYYENDPEMIFSGYLGDSINPKPEDKTIELSFRDKGKLLQDAMIDGVTNVIDPSGWDIESKSDSDIFNISSVNATTGVFTTSAVHGLTTGDKIRFNQVDSLPVQSNGDRLTGTYTVTVLSTTTFSLDSITLSGITTSIDIRVQYVFQIGNQLRYKIYDKVAALDTSLNTLTFEIDRTDNIKSIIYNERQALIYLDGANQKEFKYLSNFLPVNKEYKPTVAVGSNETITLEKDFEAITTSTNSLATGRNVKDFDEKGVTTSSISTSTDKITFSTDHLLTTGDIVSLASTVDLPENASGVLDQFYEVGVVDSTNIQLYTRDSFGSLQLIDITDAGSGTITVISTQFRVGDVIRNILEDLETIQGINYVNNIESDFNTNVGLNTDIWNGKTVWDTLQDLASMKALYIAYLWHEESQDFVLTINNLPDKTSADFTLASNEIYLQTQEITGADIRNAIFVNYYNSLNGDRESVSTTDTISIARYGTRPSVITEGKTSAINNPTIAQQFADAILATSKDRVIESVATIPFQYEYGTNTRIEVGNTVGLTYNYLDNTGGTVPYYAIESIEHSYNAGVYQTRLRGNKQQVRTSVRRYKQIEARPGAFQQQIGRDVSELYQIPAPTDLSVLESGVLATSAGEACFSILQWKRPENYYPLFYTLQIKKSDGTYQDGEEYKIENSSDSIIGFTIKIESYQEYKVRVFATSKASVKGVVSDEITISEVESPVFAIRTQTRFDEWLSTLSTSSSTPTELAYKKIIIYDKGSDYTYDQSTNPSKFVEAENLTIEFVGNARIDYTAESDTTDRTFLAVYCNNFFGKNINMDITNDDTTGSRFVFGIALFQLDTTEGIISLSDCDFLATDYDDNIYAQYFNFTDNKKVTVSDSRFNEFSRACIVMEGDYSDTKSKITIKNNIFTNSEKTLGGAVNDVAIYLFESECNDIEISNNTFENTEIWITNDTADLELLNITNNKFLISEFNYTDSICIRFIMATKDVNLSHVQNNSVKITESTSGKGYVFLYNLKSSSNVTSGTVGSGDLFKITGTGFVTTHGLAVDDLISFDSQLRVIKTVSDTEIVVYQPFQSATFGTITKSTTNSLNYSQVSGNYATTTASSNGVVLWITNDTGTNLTLENNFSK